MPDKPASEIHVYISYARQDQATASQLGSLLSSHGWTVFFDHLIPPGRSWREHIGEAIYKSRCIIVLWSEHSIQSQFVIEEADQARQSNRLFPITIDRARPPFGFRQIQAFDLSEWNGNTSDPRLSLLLSDLFELLGAPDAGILATKSVETVLTNQSSGRSETEVLSARREIHLPDRQHQRKREVLEAKIALVGFGGVGKTSLVRRIFLKLPFRNDESTTHGIAIADTSLKLNALSDAHLHIWDFGGQEIMHMTHQFFLTDRCLYLLVLNGRENREHDDAAYWLRMIKNYAYGSTVIVILNKYKNYPFNINLGQLHNHFHGIHSVHATDCADDFGIEDLQATICRVVDALPGIHDQFPDHWFAIKTSLEADRSDYLTYSQFRRVCEQHGEHEPAAQDRLADFLHRLGVMLNFRDDPRLHDTHVLRPQWLTNGIYLILNSPKASKQNGELSIQDVQDILPTQQYPISQMPFLLYLMRKFDLCVQFSDDGNDFFVPQVSRLSEPECVTSLEDEAALRFEYEYETEIPGGLIPRFIARTAALSFRDTRWRGGVVLGFEGNRALVKVDQLARRVRVFVHGPAQGRRRLLAIVRSELEQISRAYAISPIATVPVPDHPGLSVPYEKLTVLERNAVASFREVFGEKIVEIEVQLLLGGVDIGPNRVLGGRSEYNRKSCNVFVSYSHVDEIFREELEIHLKLLQREGVLSLWTDRCILPGESWKDGIDSNLEVADIILLLISADFMASGYCWDVELRRALERHRAGSARVVPVIVRACSWKSAPFAFLQALPEGGRAVVEWGTERFARDVPWTQVEDGIRRVVLARAGRSHQADLHSPPTFEVEKRPGWQALLPSFFSKLWDPKRR